MTEINGPPVGNYTDGERPVLYVSFERREGVGNQAASLIRRLTSLSGKAVSTFDLRRASGGTRRELQQQIAGESALRLGFYPDRLVARPRHALPAVYDF